MAGFKRFEEILAWQKARQSTKLVYEETLNGDFAKDYDLRGQIRRSSISISANSAEGFGRKSDKEFAQFLSIALASAYETQSHLYLALDIGYISQEKFFMLYGTLDEICRMTFSLRQNLIPKHSG